MREFVNLKLKEMLIEARYSNISLFQSHPDIAKEWHPTKNAGLWNPMKSAPLTPETATSGSEKKVWWQCSNDPEHEWQASIRGRTQYDVPCPYCRGWLPGMHRMTNLGQTLAQAHPELAADWDMEGNAPLTPNDVTPGQNLKAKWICQKCGHRWEAKINMRRRSLQRGSSSRGCPECYKQERNIPTLPKRTDPRGKGSSSTNPRRSSKGGHSSDVGPRPDWPAS